MHGEQIDIRDLWDIDTPETKQACLDGWPAGLKSTATLRRLLQNKPISGEPRKRDRYGRSIVLCRAGEQDLGAAMVSAGMAWAFTRYNSDYNLQERAAVGARFGLHAHD